MKALLRAPGKETKSECGRWETLLAVRRREGGKMLGEGRLVMGARRRGRLASVRERILSTPQM